MAHSLNDAVFKFFLTVTETTNRQTMLSVKEMTTPTKCEE